MEPPKTAGDVRDALANTMVQVHARQMDPRTANALAYLATSLLRAIEVFDLESRLDALEANQLTAERAVLPSSPTDGGREIDSDGIHSRPVSEVGDQAAFPGLVRAASLLRHAHLGGARN